MKKMTGCVMVAIILMGFATKAQAFIVYDPSNYVENFLTAIRAEISNVNEQLQTAFAETEVTQQLMQLANEAKMLANDLLDLTKLPGDLLSPITTAYNAAMVPVQKVRALTASAERVEQQFGNAGSFQVHLLGNAPPRISALRHQQYEEAMERNRQAMEAASETAAKMGDDAANITGYVGLSRGATGNLAVQQAGNEIAGATALQLVEMKGLLATNTTLLAAKDAQDQQGSERAAALQEYFHQDLIPGTYTPGTGF